MHRPVLVVLAGMLSVAAAAEPVVTNTYENLDAKRALRTPGKW